MRAGAACPDALLDEELSAEADAAIRTLVEQLPDHGLRSYRQLAIIELFHRVADLAPGSYGLLYVHDDEDPEHDRHFRVFRLIRGTVTEHADHLLSPVIPTLEDEYTA